MAEYIDIEKAMIVHEPPKVKDINQTVSSLKEQPIQYTWYTNNGDIIAKFKIWDWWDGKNVSDLEISEKYRGLGISYQLLDYATKQCGARNLAVKKNNTIAKHVYDKYGFQVTEEDNEYYYMSLNRELQEKGNRNMKQKD